MDVYIKWRLPVLLGWVHSSWESRVHVAMSTQTPPNLTLQFLRKLLAEAEPDVCISSFDVSFIVPYLYKFSYTNFGPWSPM
jgi:hypothetical protein